MAEITDAEMAQIALDLSARFTPEVLHFAGILDFMTRAALGVVREQPGLQEVSNHLTLGMYQVILDYCRLRGDIDAEQVKACVRAICQANASLAEIIAIPDEVDGPLPSFDHLRAGPSSR